MHIAINRYLDGASLRVACHSLRGIIEGDSVPDVFIPRLIDLYKQRRFPFDKLITYYDFEDINKAVDDTEQGKVIKAVLRP